MKTRGNENSFVVDWFRLSERNCVELIGLLVKEGLLNVIYTTDGKDIITEQRLIREILDEIYANGGNFFSQIFFFLKFNFNI